MAIQILAQVGSLFKGTFDGLDNTISNLYVNRPTQDYIGLFGHTDGATVKNIALVNVEIIGRDYVGSLVGMSAASSYITNSYATGEVSGHDRVGGLVGSNYTSTISNSHATATVNGSRDIVGGLAGENAVSSYISTSYSKGAIVSGESFVGGLVGYNYSSSSIVDSYAASTVSGTSEVGGFLGNNDAPDNIAHSFYDREISGQDKGIGGADTSQNGVTGKTTKGMRYGQTFKSANWDIVVDDTVTSTTPIRKYLSANGIFVWTIAKTTLNYTLGDRSTTYNGNIQNLSDFYTSASSIFGTDYDFIGSSDYKFQVSGADVTGYKNAGTYNNIKVGSNNEFLAIASMGNSDGAFTIGKKDITGVTGITASNKTYDGNTDATVDASVATFVGKVGSDTLNITSSSSVFSDKNAGVNKTVNISGLVLGGDDASNYNLTNPTTTTTADITQKEIGVSVSKVYDGDADLASGFGAMSGGTIDGDVVNITGVATLSSKNVGSYNSFTTQTLTIDNSNYMLGSSVEASITKKAISLENFQAQDKLYDGTTTATVSADGIKTSDIIGSDVVSFDIALLEGVFENAQAGVGKNVYVKDGLVLSGADASNYKLEDVTTATITAPAQSKEAIEVRKVTTAIFNDEATSFTPPRVGVMALPRQALNIEIVGEGVKLPDGVDEFNLEDE